MTLKYKPQNGPDEPLTAGTKQALDAAVEATKTPEFVRRWNDNQEGWGKVWDRLRIEIAYLVCNALQHSEEVKAEVESQRRDAYPETLFAWLRESGWNSLSDSDKAELRKRITTAYGIAAADNPEALRWAVTTRGDGLAILTFVDDSADRPTGAEVLDPVDSLRFATEHGWWGMVSAGLVESTNDDTSANWLRLLAWFWLDDKAKTVKAELEREAARAKHRPMIVRPRVKDGEGDRYIAIDRAMEPMAAVWGGLLRVDSEAYGEAPEGVSVLKPVSWEVTTSDWQGLPAKHKFLPGLAPLASAQEYLITTATRTANLAQLPAISAKLLPLMFALTGRDPRPVGGTLRELTALVYPDKKVHKRECASVGMGVACIANLRVLFPGTSPKSKGFSSPIFDIGYELSNEPEAEIEVALSKILQRRMSGERGQPGYFLLNLDGLLRLDTSKPGTVGLYMNIAGKWHTVGRQSGIFQDDRFKPLLVSELARDINAYPQSAVEGGMRQRKSKSEAEKRLVSDLEELRDKGLVGTLDVKGRGDERTVKVLPPDAYKEACKAACKRPNRRGRTTK